MRHGAQNQEKFDAEAEPGCSLPVSRVESPQGAAVPEPVQEDDDEEDEGPQATVNLKTTCFRWKDASAVLHVRVVLQCRRFPSMRNAFLPLLIPLDSSDET